MNSGSKVVVVLGAGINGAAIARELALNGVSVWLIDQADLATGATSGSSRLIHGGLRYLEYGELDLVKESLAERTRLLTLAPDYVHPLKLWIPSSNRFGGAVGAAGKFFGWNWWPSPVPADGRGSWLIRAGLAAYDAYARDPSLPKHRTGRLGEGGAPPVDRHKYRWVTSYYDAQVTYPERLVVAMLADADRYARAAGAEFRLFTYHQANLRGKTLEIAPQGADNADNSSPREIIVPDLIINATGAWVDETLARLHVPAERLIGGTKGSHLFSFQPRLMQLLNGDGIYAEAADGRPIFITPLGETVLIGTTDMRYEGPPENAIATDQEQDYLVEAVNTILPDARLTRDDVAFHYSAVRPLPYVHAKTTAAITRRHALTRNSAAAVPILSVIGGKLTTMRSLAESTAATVLGELRLPVKRTSREEPIGTGQGADSSESASADIGSDASRTRLAAQTGFSRASVVATWMLHGAATHEVLSQAAKDNARTLLDGTDLPVAVARCAVDREHARTLGDLVERRLMLLYHQPLTIACLRQLAELLDPSAADKLVSAEIVRLQTRYGRRVE